MITVETLGMETGVNPVDINGVGADSFWISMSRHDHMTILIQKGAWAGGTPTVTLEQASNVAGDNAQALGFIEFFSKSATQAASVWVQTDVVSDSFNLTTSANEIIAIEVDGSDLDINDLTNDFAAIRVRISSPGPVADLLSVVFIGTDPAGRKFPHDDMKVDTI